MTHTRKELRKLIDELASNHKGLMKINPGFTSRYTSDHGAMKLAARVNAALVNLMVTGESKSSGKWCDPVVRDEKMSKDYAQAIVDWAIHSYVCALMKSDNDKCDCGIDVVWKQAQSILEQD